MGEKLFDLHIIPSDLDILYRSIPYQMLVDIVKPKKLKSVTQLFFHPIPGLIRESDQWSATGRTDDVAPPTTEPWSAEGQAIASQQQQQQPQAATIGRPAQGLPKPDMQGEASTQQSHPNQQQALRELLRLINLPIVPLQQVVDLIKSNPPILHAFNKVSPGTAPPLYASWEKSLHICKLTSALVMLDYLLVT